MEAEKKSNAAYEEYAQLAYEYDKKYKEYTSLHREIEEVQKLFIEIGDSWKKATDGKEKERLDQQIKQLYQVHSQVKHVCSGVLLCTQKTQAKKQRHDKLHKELKEMKQRLKEAQAKLTK